MITRLAWRPWLSRVSLNRDLESVRSRVAAIGKPEIKQKLAVRQKVHGVLPGPLGELPGIKPQPPMTEPEPN